MKRQTDPYGKATKNETKILYLTNCPIFRFENKPSSGAKSKMKIKLKVSSLEFEEFPVRRALRGLPTI